MTLGSADHPNLVKLIGYCAEGDQRLLVYEYMPLGSLDKHLHGMQKFDSLRCMSAQPIFSWLSLNHNF